MTTIYSLWRDVMRLLSTEKDESVKISFSAKALVAVIFFLTTNPRS